ncbi:MAG: four helix bundle protein [Candidatus Hydrogenedentes bacterium]|nr:four helix bundle protein [Candidatus Hydrogenedentota bacterium]
MADKLKKNGELDVWKKSVDMVVSIYELSKTFPASEKFGLTSQIQRAAVSIPANIAEGYGRSHRREYMQHVSIARGSLAELETHLIIAVKLGYVSRDESKIVWNLAQIVGKMLIRLSQSLSTTNSNVSV